MSAAFKQVPVAMRSHPFGARQMTLPGAPRPIAFSGRIDVQHDAGHFGPIRAFELGIDETQIRDEMFVVIILALRKCLMDGDWPRVWIMGGIRACSFLAVKIL
jgi:hypothetical protein